MEKKIGILTFHNYDNYGAILQSYALERVLSAMGTRPEIIDYDCRYISHPFDMNHLKKKGLFNYIYGAIGHICYLPRRRACNLFRRHIKYGPTVTREDIAQKTAGYDILLAGSDQIWDYTLTDFDRTYFLDFAGTGQRKYRYAASIGEHLPPEEYRREYTRLLSGFDRILVRENYGADVVEQLTGRRPQCVCDPTLFLNGEQWAKLSTEPKIKEKYILVYQLGINREIVDFVNMAQNQTGYRVVYVPFPLVGTVRNCRIELSAGPSQWLGLFKNAQLVISDSFHGVIFALLFHKLFYTIYDGHHSNRRVEELLSQIGLSERTMKQADTAHLLEPIDYERADKQIRKMRADSLDALHKMINE